MSLNLFEHSIDFLHDPTWLRCYGYQRLGGDLYIRSGNIPVPRWDVYKEELVLGWEPTLEEFARWHPLDQERYEIQWVYDLNYNEQKVYSDCYSTFALFPLNALKFYWLHGNSFNFSGNFSVLELYHANFLTLKAQYQPDKNDFSLVHCVVQDRFSFDKLMGTYLFGCALNNSLVYVVFCGRVVRDLISSQVDVEFQISLDRRLLTMPELALLSQEGY